MRKKETEQVKGAQSQNHDKLENKVCEYVKEQMKERDRERLWPLALNSSTVASTFSFNSSYERRRLFLNFSFCFCSMTSLSINTCWNHTHSSFSPSCISCTCRETEHNQQNWIMIRGNAFLHDMFQQCVYVCRHSETFKVYKINLASIRKDMFWLVNYILIQSEPNEW